MLAKYLLLGRKPGGIVHALRILGLTFLLVLPSCLIPGPEADDEIEIVYDPCAGIGVQAAPDTSEAELVAIDKAIKMWTQVADLDISRDPTRLFEQILPIQFEEASLLFRGVYQDQVGDVVINRRLVDPDEQAITIAHEFGHAIGLPHIESRDSVMNSGNLLLLPLTTDVDALGELWGPCVRNNRDLSQLQQLQIKTPNRQ